MKALRSPPCSAGSSSRAAGCGGRTTARPPAARAPPRSRLTSAVVYATINTDVDSDQVDQLEELLAKFPDRERLLAELQKSLAEDDLSWETDIKPALGETLDLVLLDFEGRSVRRGPQARRRGEVRGAAGQGATSPPRHAGGRGLDGASPRPRRRSTASRPPAPAARSRTTSSSRTRWRGSRRRRSPSSTSTARPRRRPPESAGGASTGENRLKAFAAALGAESSGLRLEGALTSELEDELREHRALRVEAARGRSRGRARVHLRQRLRQGRRRASSRRPGRSTGCGSCSASTSRARPPSSRASSRSGSARARRSRR